MKRILLTFAGILLMANLANAQAPEKGDTLIIEVGKSKLMFIVNSLEDIEKIKNYDLNKIMQRLEGRQGADSVIVLSLSDIPETPDTPDEPSLDEPDMEDPDEPEVTQIDTDVIEVNYDKFRHFFNIELGMNNYLENGSTPSSNAAYNVRPWGSWYVALGSVNKFNLSRSFGLEAGINVSWYNFKFQDDDTYVIRGDEGVEFINNPENLDASFKKSKLTVAYINASLVPVFNFGKGSNGFRAGLGMYAGYRIGSYMKVKYNDGDGHKKKNHDPFYLNDFRYGIRLQTGYRGTDLFFNYDLNELFRDNRGPSLNAFSFGIIF